jgi:hypothetical protein
MKKLFEIARRTVVFLTLLQFALFAFYLAGSRNRFLDSSLVLVLNLTCVSSILLVVCSTFYAVLTVIESAATRKVSCLLRLCPIAPAAASAVALAFASRALARLAGG